jgi:NADPH:quinone reductase-like Zn-dependent oxidoreductase
VEIVTFKLISWFLDIVFLNQRLSAILDAAMRASRRWSNQWKYDFDGGYAEYMIAGAEAVTAVPDELPPEEVGPFMCAGVTLYTRSGIRARATATLLRYTGSAA